MTIEIIEDDGSLSVTLVFPIGVNKLRVQISRCIRKILRGVIHRIRWTTNKRLRIVAKRLCAAENLLCIKQFAERLIQVVRR